MKFFKKIFGNKKSSKQVIVDKGVSVSVKDDKSNFSYIDFNFQELENIKKNIDFFNVAFSELLQFDKEPANHPYNLDEFLSLWGSAGFGNFMGIDKGRHIGFLSYGFGQYMCDKYGFKWQIKSDGYGTQTVIRMIEPIEIELYPVDSTLRAIESQKKAVFSDIETKLKGSLELFEK